MSLVRGLTEIGGKAAKKTAPFYSAVDEALANLKRPKGTGAEFLTEVMKTKGVKKAEIADRKLEQAFKAKGKMTKEEAQQILKENPPPKLRERELTEISDDMREAELRDKIETSGYDSWDEVPSRIIRKWNEEIDENLEKYGDYRTPGGSNYREILLKLPVQGEDVKKLNEISMALHGVPYTSLMGDKSELAKMRLAVKREYKNVYGESGRVAEDRGMYQSNHWKEDPNVLAHMRVQDRTGPNGEKILHVEEIQSDWHQAGRKKGYKPDDYIQQSNALEKEFSELGERRAQLLKQAELMPTHGPEFTSLLDEANSITPKLMRLQEQRDNLQNVINYGVPDAPFKKNWHELAMKRLLNYAADNGYDSIAITPGAEQAKRYDLSKHVDELLYKQNPDGTYQLSAQAQGRGNMIGQAIPAEKLEDYVGKDVAQKIIDNLGTERNLGGSGSVSQPQDIWGSLSGEGLQVGGEGMKGFYDKILPDYLNTFGKPYGAQVQPHSFPISTRDPLSTSWGGGQGDHPFITVQDLNEPFEGMVELMRRHPETGEETLVGRMTRAESERRMAEELQKLDTVNQTKLHNFPITPEMREQIKQKGLPLYQQIGIPTAGAGAASQFLQPEEEQGLSGGGMVNSAIKQAHLAKLAKMRQEMAPRAEAIKNLIAKDANAYLRDVVPNSLTNPEIEAEIARMAARAKAAGQQEGVLPMAQRDANLAKFLEESKIKNRVYHGTGADVQEFKPSVIGAMGPGTYVTTNPDVASGYSKVISHRRPENNPNVLPLHVQVKNPFPISSVNRSGSEFFLKFDPTGKLSDAEVIELAKKAGYDAVHALEEGELNIFDPSRIKSATGNRGTYDINEPDITKSGGGAIAKMALKAAPAPKAPQIIKPSGLTELKKIVEQEKGGYGARRLERAADEIPNLEKMYQQSALREAFTGDNAQALMTMNPADFEKYAVQLNFKTNRPNYPSLEERIRQGVLDKHDLPTDEYIKFLRTLPHGFEDVPFLAIDKQEYGLPLVPSITGHEGRHRSRALTESGEKSSLVRLLPNPELREPLPRRSQQEYIDALKKELEMTGNKVVPEDYGTTRPPIILPDVYAKGGSVKRKVKKADGGAINYNTAPDMSDVGRIIQGAPFKHGGKVNMTANRDAMFMELSNKKLKRK